MVKKESRKAKPQTRQDAQVPCVFISYTHENDDHKRWVRELCSDLIENGIDTILDQWDLPKGGDIATFMEKGVRKAQRVLMVLTPEYKRKAELRKGGVGYESLVITTELMNDLSTTKFIGILKSGTWSDAVPSFLASRNHADFTEDAKYKQSLEELVREIHGMPKNPKPELKPSPFGSNGAGVVKIATHKGHKKSQPDKENHSSEVSHIERSELKVQHSTIRIEGRPVHLQLSYKALKRSTDLHKYALLGILTLNIPPTQGEWLLKLLWPVEVRIVRQKGLEEGKEYLFENAKYKELLLHGNRRIWPGETVDILGPNCLAELEYEFDDAIWSKLNEQPRNLHYTVYLEDHRPVEGVIPFGALNQF